jgi:hypothetical protein
VEAKERAFAVLQTLVRRQLDLHFSDN